MNKLKLKSKFVSKITIHKTLNVEQNVYPVKIKFFYIQNREKYGYSFLK